MSTAVAAVAFALGASPAAYASMPEPATLAGPELLALAVDPAAVDVSTAAASVAVTARVADADGVASVNVRLADGTPVTLSLTGGSATDGTWSGVATVPAFTAHGAAAAFVETADMAGTAATPVVGNAFTVADAAPAAPARTLATAAGDDAVRVEWAAPPANGGSPVQSYDVTAAPADGSRADTVVPPAASLPADATSATLPWLSPDTRYVVHVAARNAAGPGQAAVADATTAVGEVTVADAPTSVAATPLNAALLVQWVVPASGGGSAVTRYDVAATPRTPGLAPPPVVTAAPGTPTALVSGLANGVTYDVAVTAVNAVGSSLAGTVAATPRTVPGMPRVTSLSPRNASVVVGWIPPGSDGGAPVTSYAVTASPGGATVTVPGSARTATVTGLPNGSPVTFRVVAVNAAGAGLPSAASPPTTPRILAKIVVSAQPAAAVVYGTPSTVGATLVTVGGTPLPGQRVDLLAQRKGTTAWRLVAAGTTGSTGRVALKATLPATSALRLHHPAGAVAAPDVAARSVAVAPRVTASAARIRVGQTVVAGGNVAPAQVTGSAVRLQRLTSDGWRTIASGRMTTATAYRVSWKPTRSAKYTLRVVKPADADHATGTSARWSQVVDPESAADIARAIRYNSRITLETTHVSGVSDLANARQNIVDVSAGRLARVSAYQNAPGGSTTLDRRLLAALRRMGVAGRVTVSEIAGGSHSRGSAHYYGRGLDISWVNGRHVDAGSDYSLAVDTCRAFGAARIFHPRYDPYGGHSRHVHCDWA